MRQPYVAIMLTLDGDEPIANGTLEAHWGHLPGDGKPVSLDGQRTFTGWYGTHIESETPEENAIGVALSAITFWVNELRELKSQGDAAADWADTPEDQQA